MSCVEWQSMKKQNDKDKRSQNRQNDSNLRNSNLKPVSSKDSSQKSRLLNKDSASLMKTKVTSCDVDEEGMKMQVEIHEDDFGDSEIEAGTDSEPETEVEEITKDDGNEMSLEF